MGDDTSRRPLPVLDLGNVHQAAGTIVFRKKRKRRRVCIGRSKANGSLVMDRKKIPHADERRRDERGT